MVDVQLSAQGSVIKTAYELEADSNAFTDADHTKLDGIAAGAEVNAVNSVNSATGAVVLDPDDLDDALTTNKFTTTADITKLSGIASSATANPNAIDNVAEDTTPQLGGNLDGNSNEIFNFENSYNNQTGTTYTLVDGDKGKVITLNNAAAITVTLPNNLPIGWSATIIQLGAGQVTFSAATGASFNNRQSHTKAAGQYAMTSLAVYANSGGSSAVYALGGDTTT